MSEFIPTAIVELQNTLSSKNIERLKQKFIGVNYNAEDPPVEIDDDKGVLYFYDSYADNLVGKKFETELEKLLWTITNKIKAEIDLSRIKLNDKERTLFWSEILHSIDNKSNFILG